MSKLILEIPYLPPSVNEAYKFNRKTGVMYLVKEAAAFKKGLGLHLNEKYLKEIHTFDTTAVYKASYYFHFLKENLINEKFGKDKRIKSLYKAVDLDNRLKLLQDSIASSLGFNDSHIFEIEKAQKRIANREFTVVVLEKVKLEDYEGEIHV